MPANARGWNSRAAPGNDKAYREALDEDTAFLKGTEELNPFGVSTRVRKAEIRVRLKVWEYFKSELLEGLRRADVRKSYCQSTMYSQRQKKQLCPKGCNLCPKARPPKRKPKRKPPPKKKPKKPRTPHETPYAFFHQNLNERASPCNDFYEFACGNYIRRHPANAPSDSFQIFGELEDRVHKQLLTLIMSNGTESSAAIKTMRLYRDKCFNTTEIETERTKTLWTTIQSIGQGFPMLAASFDATKFDLKDTLVKMTAETGSHFLYDIEAAKMPDSSVAPVFSPSDLIVTSPMVYEDKDSAANIQALHDFLVEIVGLIAGDTKSGKTFADIDTGVQEVMDYEKALAKILTNNGVGKPDLKADWMMQKKKMADVQTAVSMIKWDDYLKDDSLMSAEVKTYFTKDPTVYLFTDKMLKEVDAHHKAGDKKVLANYLFIQFIIKNIPYLDSRFVTAANKFATKLDGSPHRSERQDDCYDQILSIFPLVSDHLYAKKYLSRKTVSIMNGMIEDLRGGMMEMFKGEKWMAKKSKDYAVRKVKKMRKIVGVVEDAKDEKKLDARYKGIQLTATDSYQKMSVKVKQYTTQEQLKQLINPQSATQSESMRSSEVNAMHIWEENLIFMSAAILQSPFLDPTQPAAVNYGSIGFIVGHEMTHGFDTGGSQYDENGNMTPWWDNPTKNKFDTKAKCFIDLYGKQTEPKVRKPVDGNLTIPENIADNGGIRAAFKAYQRHLKGKRERHVKGYAKYTNAQTFFISYGTSFCSSFSKELTEQRLKLDTHSPTRFRVNVVLQNYPEFAKAFKCKKGTKMNPRNQCSVW
ncbi:Phosphate-regulating neutral endopeptidase [Aphelenchoides besseyi]|nr:Phosphate-regulating neutral endopeptidase [Aphelenchoides besseyi]